MIEIKIEMLKKGITQIKMAELTGFAKSTVNNHLKGRTKCSERKKAKYLDVLKLC
jgi:predicted transcriptional regulator